MLKSRMLKRSTSLIAVFLLTFMATNSLRAQDDSDTRAKSGSFYSAIGFGIPADIHSPETMGLGLSGV